MEKVHTLHPISCVLCQPRTLQPLFYNHFLLSALLLGSAFVQSQPVKRTAKQQVLWTRSPDAAALTSVRFTNDLSASHAGANKPPAGTCLLYFAVSNRKKEKRKKRDRSSPPSHRAAQSAALQQQRHQRVKRQHLIRLQILPVLYIVPALRLPCW